MGRTPRPERYDDATWDRALGHRGLVATIAFAFARRRCSLTHDDLMNEGLVGVCRALSSYQPARGPLSSWVALLIRDAIRRAIAARDRTIRIPTYAWQDVRMQDRGRHLRPNRARIARETRLALAPCVSLAGPVADGVFARANRIDPTEWAEVLMAIDRLPERERVVIRGRYVEYRTRVDIGRGLGLTRTRVSQIERLAIDHLRTSLVAEERAASCIARAPAPTSA